MTKEKRSKMMFLASQECVYHAKDSMSRNQYNMAVRRAQEAVELQLKGLSALLGYDYPKDHDQAPLLMRVLEAKGVDTANYAKELERISVDLSRKRGPALQQEEGYDKDTAETALEDMNFVLNTAETIKQQI